MAMKKKGELLIVLYILLFIGAVLFFSNSGFSGNVIGGNVSVRESTEDENIDLFDDTDEMKVYLMNINRTVTDINSTVEIIRNKTIYLYNRENCSKDSHINEVGTKCWFLDQINASLANISAATNLTAKKVWEYTTRNLTWYGNQSIIQKIVTAINKTTLNINTTVTRIQTNVTVIRDHLDYLYWRENCSYNNAWNESGTKCYYLYQIKKTVDDINASTNLTAKDIWSYNNRTLTEPIYNLTKEIFNTTRYIWNRFKRFNYSVIHEENITGSILNSTVNITIRYNITVPAKEGFNTSDYLPVRWKFWFINTDTGRCVNQVREFRNVAPYCNPLQAQYVERVGNDIVINITLRPALAVGNYTIVRELEVDPNEIWIDYGKGPIGNIEVREATVYENLTGKSSIERGEDKGYITQSKWSGIGSNSAIPTILHIKGRVTDHLGNPLQGGSLRVNIIDSFAPTIMWSNEFHDVVKEGEFDVYLGTYNDLSLIPGRKYRTQITVCDGVIFNIKGHDCQEYTMNSVL